MGVGIWFRLGFFLVLDWFLWFVDQVNWLSILSWLLSKVYRLSFWLVLVCRRKFFFLTFTLHFFIIDIINKVLLFFTDSYQRWRSRRRIKILIFVEIKLESQGLFADWRSWAFTNLIILQMSSFRLIDLGVLLRIKVIPGGWIMMLMLGFIFHLKLFSSIENGIGNGDFQFLHIVFV